MARKYVIVRSKSLLIFTEGFMRSKFKARRLPLGVEGYFPTQKLLNMELRMSSLVTSPVTSPKESRASSKS